MVHEVKKLALALLLTQPVIDDASLQNHLIEDDWWCHPCFVAEMMRDPPIREPIIYPPVLWEMLNFRFPSPDNPSHGEYCYGDCRIP